MYLIILSQPSTLTIAANLKNMMLLYWFGVAIILNWTHIKKLTYYMTQ